MGIQEKKYMNAILFLCNYLNGTIVGKKKLYKLLYYLDFDNYEYKTSMSSITGDTYIAWKMGPVPNDRGKILKTMEQKKMIKIKKIRQSEYLNDAEAYESLQEPDMSIFSDDEKFIMERVARNYGGLTVKQLETLTRSEAPYIATKQNEEIDYSLTFYRGTDFNDDLARM